MVRFEGFKRKKDAVAFQKTHGGLLAYESDRLGRSENRDYYRVAVVVGKLNKLLYPFCVFYVK